MNENFSETPLFSLKNNFQVHPCLQNLIFVKNERIKIRVSTGADGYVDRHSVRLSNGY